MELRKPGNVTELNDVFKEVVSSDSTFMSRLEERISVIEIKLRHLTFDYFSLICAMNVLMHKTCSFFVVLKTSGSFSKVIGVTEIQDVF